MAEAGSTITVSGITMDKSKLTIFMATPHRIQSIILIFSDYTINLTIPRFQERSTLLDIM